MGAKDEVWISHVTNKGFAVAVHAVEIVQEDVTYCAELQMVKVLFGLNSLASYLEKGVLPSSMEDLPYPMKVVVEACIRKEWNRVGKQTYFEILHPLIISILCTAPQKSSTAAASVLLIGSSEEFGVPITVHQVATVNNLGSGNYRTDDRLE
ncbi:hypothetical protein ACS0TY_021611 [Phlomoides rotata]